MGPAVWPFLSCAPCVGLTAFSRSEGTVNLAAAAALCLQRMLTETAHHKQLIALTLLLLRAFAITHCPSS